MQEFMAIGKEAANPTPAEARADRLINVLLLFIK
jgi:hypothetical protein